MNRIIVALLAIVGGAIASYFCIMLLGGAILGALWLYVFGDNPWPTGWEPFLIVFLVAMGLALWVLFARAIWMRFKPA